VVGTGVFSYATHGAVVAVDPETGFVELVDFAVAEDCGTMVNPLIVEGQIRGALAGLGAPGGAEVNETPLTPRRVLAAIEKARAAG